MNNIINNDNKFIIIEEFHEFSYNINNDIVDINEKKIVLNNNNISINNLVRQIGYIMDNNNEQNVNNIIELINNFINCNISYMYDYENVEFYNKHKVKKILEFNIVDKIYYKSLIYNNGLLYFNNNNNDLKNNPFLNIPNEINNEINNDFPINIYRKLNGIAYYLNKLILNKQQVSEDKQQVSEDKQQVSEDKQQVSEYNVKIYDIYKKINDNLKYILYFNKLEKYDKISEKKYLNINLNNLLNNKKYLFFIDKDMNFTDKINDNFIDFNYINHLIDKFLTVYEKEINNEKYIEEIKDIYEYIKIDLNIY